MSVTSMVFDGTDIAEESVQTMFGKPPLGWNPPANEVGEVRGFSDNDERKYWF